mmetsp:Transcript_21071/g.26878  ORF Transcript_21071/g.26878 Transcript_21071/m.26878 type:complete len:115 (+) Transcript_21071:195-539(+)
MLRTMSRPKIKTKGARTYVAGLSFFLSPLSFSEISSLLFFAWSGDNAAAVLLVFVLEEEKNNRDGLFVAVVEGFKWKRFPPLFGTVKPLQQHAIDAINRMRMETDGRHAIVTTE